MVAALPPLSRPLQQSTSHLPYPQTSFSTAAHTTFPPLPPPLALGSTLGTASTALGSNRSTSALPPPPPPPQILTSAQLQAAYVALPSLYPQRQLIIVCFNQ